jgi:multidrug resistance efflux pump
MSSIEDHVIGPPRGFDAGGVGELDAAPPASRVSEFARKAGTRLLRASDRVQAEYAAARAARNCTVGMALGEAERWERQAERDFKITRMEYGRIVAGVIMGEASEAMVDQADAALDAAERELRRAAAARSFLSSTHTRG